MKINENQTQINTYQKQNHPMKKAIVAYLVKEEKVLLGVRKQSSTNLGVKKIAGIGGKLEDGEQNEDALFREVKEEINVIPIKYEQMGRVIFLNHVNYKWNLDVTVYTITNWKGNPQESDEITPQWFPIEELPNKNMFEDNKYWLPYILAEKKKVDATFLYSEEHAIVESEVRLY